MMPKYVQHKSGRYRPGYHPGNWKGGVVRSGYKRVYLPLHPRAGKSGYVREHILIAEKVLGRPLPLSVQVHHVNENRSDNRNLNLVICEGAQYHKLLHQRMRAYQATGNPNSVKCRYCSRWGVHGAEEMYTPKVASQSYHRKCSVDAARTQWRKHHG